jgi:hypothetical protein
MSTTTVAAIGTITTASVAVAAFLFNYFSSRSDRAAARVLAWDMHSHERELAREARQDQKDLVRAERAYDDRRRTYLEVLDGALPVVQDVQSPRPASEEPAASSDVEHTRMRVNVVAFASPEVQTRFEEFSLAAKTHLSDRADDGVGLPADPEETATGRQATVDAFENLCRVIKAELAEL